MYSIIFPTCPLHHPRYEELARAYISQEKTLHLVKDDYVDTVKKYEKILEELLEKKRLTEEKAEATAVRMFLR